MDTNDKIEAYEKLVAKRKLFRFSDEGLTNPSSTPFDVNEIEPWAQWQNNLDADILLVGQEYCDLDTYVATQGKVERYPEEYKYPSNKNLYDFFKILGFDIGHPLTPNKNNPIFFTNAVMGLKTPPMSANFKTSWLTESRDEFLAPLIDIINPTIIIAVGAEATKTLGAIYGFKTTSMMEMVGNGPIESNRRLIFPVFHTGGLGLRNRARTEQIADWERIKELGIDTIKRVTPIFEPEPETWGLRGDKYLWRRLKEKLRWQKLGMRTSQFDDLLKKEFKYLISIGKEAGNNSIFLNDLPQNGMSGGHISMDWWHETGIPLLSKRYEKMK